MGGLEVSLQARFPLLAQLSTIGSPFHYWLGGKVKHNCRTSHDLSLKSQMQSLPQWVPVTMNLEESGQMAGEQQRHRQIAKQDAMQSLSWMQGVLLGVC